MSKSNSQIGKSSFPYQMTGNAGYYDQQPPATDKKLQHSMEKHIFHMDDVGHQNTVINSKVRPSVGPNRPANANASKSSMQPP